MRSARLKYALLALIAAAVLGGDILSILAP